MAKVRSLYLVAALLTATLLSSCKFTVSTNEGVNLNVQGLQKDTPENVADFTQEILLALYNKDKEFLIQRADPEIVDDFTPELFAFLFQMQQPTARPDLAVTVSSKYRADKSLRDFVTLYHIPTEIGRDYVHIGVRGDEDSCCTISFINFDVKFGDNHKMSIYTPK